MKRLALRLALAVVTFSFGSAAAWIVAHHRQPKDGHAMAQIGLGFESRRPKNTILPKIAALPEQWSEVNRPSIQFVTDQDGWLSLNGRLWRTADGGKTWVMEFLALNENGDPEPFLGKFQFADRQTGWVITENGLYRTRDAGENWRLLRSASTDFYWLNGFYFLKDGRHGWIIENRFRPLWGEELRAAQMDPDANLSDDRKQIRSSYIYYTADGGDSWEPQPIPPTRNSLREIFAVDATHAWAFGIAGIYYFHGQSWHEVQASLQNNTANSLARSISAGFNAAPTSIFFIDPKIGWVANSGGYLGRSFDGGKTWTDVSAFSDGSNLDAGQLYFANQEDGWGLNSDGKLFASHDGGVRWTTVDDSRIFSAIFFLDAKHGWAISKDGIFRITGDSRAD